MGKDKHFKCMDFMNNLSEAEILIIPNPWGK